MTDTWPKRGLEIPAAFSFDQETHTWIQKLYEAWSSNAPVSAFALIRDSLLGQCEHLDIRISTLSSVAKIACSDQLNADSRWDELFTLAGLIRSYSNENIRKRKRAYNEANRLRNLALVAALWSPAIVFHYGWNAASQVQMNMLRACAVRYPHFIHDFRPRLNYVLLERHRQGIKYGRAKTLNEAPLQPHRDFDIVSLVSAAPDDKVENHWVTSEDGHVPVDAAGMLLKDIRPNHFRMYLLRRDRYGLLVTRGDECAPSSPQAVVLPPFKPTINPLGQLATPDGSSVEAQCPLDYEFQAHPNADVSFDFPSPPISSNVFLTSSEDLQFSNSSTAASNTTPTPPISTLRANSEARFELERNSDSHDQAILASSFDFDLESTSNLPALLSSSASNSEDVQFSDSNIAVSDTTPMSSISTLEAEWDNHLYNQDCGPLVLTPSFDFGLENTESPSHQTSTSSSLAHCTRNSAVRPLGSVSSGSSVQSPDSQELILTSLPIDTQDDLTVEKALHGRYHDMITTYIQLNMLVKRQPHHFQGDCPENDFMRAFEQAVSKFVGLGCRYSLLDCEELCSCRKEK